MGSWQLVFGSRDGIDFLATAKHESVCPTTAAMQVYVGTYACCHLSRRHVRFMKIANTRVRYYLPLMIGITIALLDLVSSNNAARPNLL